MDCHADARNDGCEVTRLPRFARNDGYEGLVYEFTKVFFPKLFLEAICQKFFPVLEDKGLHLWSKTLWLFCLFLILRDENQAP